jgi:hypothetical protein
MLEAVGRQDAVARVLLRKIGRTADLPEPANGFDAGMLIKGRAIVALALALALAAPAAFARTPRLEHLQPGVGQVIEQPLDVTIVLVGYRQGTGIRDVDAARLVSDLPTTAQPHARDPSFYGNEQPMGPEFRYRYHVVYAPRSFADGFFGWAAAHGRQGSPTLYQRLYNRQRAASRHIDRNLMIDAVDAERWLGDHARSIGVDSSRHTIFFLNWYGRPDFQDHLYTKLGEPDADTGLSDGGSDRGAGDAWGGTPADDPERPLGETRRIWFYDASAAVDAWDSSWELDHALDDPALYRMPPIWEYGNPRGYRPFDDLTGDLAKLARYVAIDLLFTPSPSFDPTLMDRDGRLISSRLQLDLTGLVNQPGGAGAAAVNAKRVRAALSDLEPYRQFSYEASNRPLAGDEYAAYRCFRSWWAAPGSASCFPGRDDPSGNSDLFYWMSDHLDTFVEGDDDREIPATLFDVTELDRISSLLGQADDDKATGAQSYVYTFNSPDTRHAPRPFSLPAPGGVTFTPRQAGGYDVTRKDGFITAGGDDLHLGDDDTTEVALPFAFPFAGRTYMSVHVNSDGNLTFGEGDVPYERSVSRLASGPPRIAPRFRDLNPPASGAVRAAVSADRAVITWEDILPYGAGGSSTFQVVLEPDGRFAMNYRRLDIPYVLAGVSEGRGAGPVRTVRFGDDSRLRWSGGTLAEDATYGVPGGVTTSLTHETGHHLGLSHPHDGYDPESGLDYGTVGDYAFTWEGDYSDSVMSYLAQQGQYSQFDRDSIDRDMMVSYIDATDALLDQIYAAGVADRYGRELEAADREAGEALARLDALDYRQAPRRALDAYRDVVRVAAKAGIVPRRVEQRAPARVVAAPARETDPKRDPFLDGPLTDRG